MKAPLILPHGAAKKLAQEFGVSSATVRYATRGVTDSPLARTIYQRAKEMIVEYVRETN